MELQALFRKKKKRLEDWSKGVRLSLYKAIILNKHKTLQRWLEEVTVITWNAWVVMNSLKPAVSPYFPGRL